MGSFLRDLRVFNSAIFGKFFLKYFVFLIKYFCKMSRRKTRLYFGKLTEDVRDRDLEKFVRGYGKVRDISIKKGYGFVVS
jgi:hypothetical protein